MNSCRSPAAQWPARLCPSARVVSRPAPPELWVRLLPGAQPPVLLLSRRHLRTPRRSRARLGWKLSPPLGKTLARLPARGLCHLVRARRGDGVRVRLGWNESEQLNFRVAAQMAGRAALALAALAFPSRGQIEVPPTVQS